MRINPFLLAFVCAAFVSCGQPEALSFVDICTIGRPYPNDADCSDGILFQFHSQNEAPEGDFHGVSLACLETGGPLGFIDLGFNQNYHNSSITFSSRRFAPEDRFPLLYASENYAPNHFYKVVVYRVVEQAGNLSLTQVQTLVMPDPDSLGIRYPHAFLNDEGTQFWIEAYSSDELRTVFLQFDLPPFREGEELRIGAPLRRFELPRKPVTDQAVCMRAGKIYQVVGLSTEAWLRVIDARRGCLLHDYDLVAAGLPHEPEAVFFWDGKLCASFSAHEAVRVVQLLL